MHSQWLLIFSIFTIFLKIFIFFMKICIYTTLRTYFKDPFNNPLEMPVQKSVSIHITNITKNNTHIIYKKLKTRWI